jgi:hypothetical protein
MVTVLVRKDHKTSLAWNRLHKASDALLPPGVTRNSFYGIAPQFVFGLPEPICAVAQALECAEPQLFTIVLTMAQAKPTQDTPELDTPRCEI